MTIKKAITKIISGGQAGVDRAALDWAIERAVPHGGWCPKGRIAEDGPLDNCYRLQETDSAGYRQRTRQNVVDSDGTLILNIGELDGGSLETQRLADRFGKQCLVIQLDLGRDNENVSKVTEWLQTHSIAVLNIAGPRESKRPGVYQLTFGFLTRLLYVSPIQVLDGYWDKPWSELPDEQRFAWTKVLTLHISFTEQEVASWWDGYFPDRRRQITNDYDYTYHPARDGERHIGNYDYSMGARTWFTMKDVAPENAAALLCQFNPLRNNCDPLDKTSDPLTVTNLETGPDDFKSLLKTFQDVARTDPMPRSLLQWLCVAVRVELRNPLLHHHSWIDEYLIAASLCDDANEIDFLHNGVAAAQAAHQAISNTAIHSLGNTRTHALAAVIDIAKKSAVAKDDYQSVWAALVEIAVSPKRPAPLLGYVENEGIKYQVDTGDGVKFYNKDALRAMMSRARKKAAQ